MEFLEGRRLERGVLLGLAIALLGFSTSFKINGGREKGKAHEQRTALLHYF